MKKLNEKLLKILDKAIVSILSSLSVAIFTVGLVVVIVTSVLLYKLGSGPLIERIRRLKDQEPVKITRADYKVPTGINTKIAEICDAPSWSRQIFGKRYARSFGWRSRQIIAMSLYNFFGPEYGLKKLKRPVKNGIKRLCTTYMLYRLMRGEHPRNCEQPKLMGHKKVRHIKHISLQLSISLKKGNKRKTMGGNALLVTANGYAFTAGHVVHEKGWKIDFSRSYARDFRGRKLKLTFSLHGQNLNLDLAIIKVRRRGPARQLICLGPPPKKGDDMHEIYHENGGFVQVTGKVTGRKKSNRISRYGLVRDVFQNSNLGKQGDSGSGVFNKYGELIGIASYGSKGFGSKQRRSFHRHGTAEIHNIRHLAKYALNDVIESLNKGRSRNIVD